MGSVGATPMTDKDITAEMTTSVLIETSMVEYGTYVLGDRAVPDARDGLKPVQRRLLWAMHKLGVTPNKASVKSARVVGNVLGSYHPHGDSSTYEALVHLTQLRYPLVHGDGNFGNRDALIEKSPAAYRYTECKLSQVGAACFNDIHIADLIPNYDESTEEPVRLPVPIPLTLANGADGIAVGLATHIPPHNLGELLRAVVHLLDEPEATTDDLLQFIKGPDYGTGILLSKRAELFDLYETGAGKLQFRSTYHIEQAGKNNKLVITGLAPGVKKKKFYDTVTELYRKKLIESAVTDETTINKQTGAINYRDTIQYRDAQIVKDRLLPLLDTTVSYQWYCLDQQRRYKQYGLVELLHEFIAFRREIEQAVLSDRKEKLSRRLGVIQAKYRATQQIDVVAQILKEAQTAAEAVKLLVQKLKLKHAWQAEALLDAQLRTLMRLQAADLRQQGQTLQAEIQHVNTQLKDVDGVVRDSLKELLKTTDVRGTRLRGKAKDFGEEQQYWVGVTADGKIDVSLDLPLQSRAAWNYVSFFPTSGEFLIVHDTNQASVVHVSYLDKYEPAGKVLGATALKNCCVITNDNRWVVFRAAQKRKQFPVVKDLGDAELLAVVGFDEAEDAFVVLQTADTEVHYLESGSFACTRPNVKARRIRLPAVTAAWFLQDTVLVDRAGNELGLPEVLDAPFYCVGECNLVSLQNGLRKVLSQEDTLKAIPAANIVVSLGEVHG